MKRKRLLPLMTCLFILAIILSGCRHMQERTEITDQFNTVNPGSPSPTAKSASAVEIFHCSSEFKDVLEKAAAKYIANNDNIIINTRYTDDKEHYSEDLRKMVNAGLGPDIFNLLGPEDVVLLKDKLVDLTDMKVTEHVVKKYLKCVTIEDRIYGVPCSIEGFALMYNKEIFEKANIDIKSIDSFEALEKAVTDIDQLKEQLKLEAVFAFPAKDTGNTGNYMSSIFLSDEFDGDSHVALNEKEIEFKYAEAMKKMVDLQNKYSVQPSYEIDAAKQAEYFTKGKVAIIQQSNWIYPLIQKIDSEFAEKKIGIIPYPVPNLEKSFNVIGATSYWGINNASDQETIDTARDFLNWLYLSEEGMELMSEDYNLILPLSGASPGSVKGPIAKYIMSYIASEDINVCVYMGYPKSWGTNVLGEEIKRYVKGDIGWEEVIKTSKDGWAKARK